MKIGILLPYKENFSPEYPGAVSLFVYETSKKSKYKKEIIEKTNFGVLINNNNVREFEIEINNFMENKNNISFDSARNIIKSNYSLEAISQQFKELYYELT